ncbi:MAG TPA: DciA family protein [Pirellulaceae bacterium]
MSSQSLTSRRVLGRRVGAGGAGMAQKRQGPTSLRDVIVDLLAERGYAQTGSTEERARTWRELVDPRIREATFPGRLHRGVLEILVRDSIVVQELSFRQTQLLQQLQHRLPDHAISALRFRVDRIADQEPGTPP